MVMNQLRDSGIFEERPPQHTGTVCFTLWTRDTLQHGASIYVMADECEVHIRVGAFRNDRFPNNDQLHEYVQSHAHGTVHGETNTAYAYRLASEHIGEVLRLIEAGL